MEELNNVDIETVVAANDEAYVEETSGNGGNTLVKVGLIGLAGYGIGKVVEFGVKQACKIPAVAAKIEDHNAKKEQKKAFSETDIEKLKRACRNVRELSLISFMLSTGCRASEIAGLNKDDINLSTMAVHVLGKGNKERTVYMDFVTAMYIKDYLASRVDDNPALFVAVNGKYQRLTKASLEVFCRKLGDGLDVGRVYPHRFRRTFATVLAKRGMPIQEISILMGHENISTTTKYICVDEISMQNNLRRYA